MVFQGLRYKSHFAGPVFWIFWCFLFPLFPQNNFYLLRCFQVIWWPSVMELHFKMNILLVPSTLCHLKNSKSASKFLSDKWNVIPWNMIAWLCGSVQTGCMFIMPIIWSTNLSPSYYNSEEVTPNSNLIEIVLYTIYYKKHQKLQEDGFFSWAWNFFKIHCMFLLWIIFYI